MKYILLLLFSSTLFSVFPNPENGTKPLPINSMDSLAFLLPKSITLSKKGNVFIWLNSECPICNKYPGIWKKLSADFPEINFIGVFTSYENKKMGRRFMKKYHVPFQWFVDNKNQLAIFFSVKTTPEVILLNERTAIFYRGATDDWFYALGKRKQVPGLFYLENALAALRHQQPLLIFQTNPVGCIFDP
jgi:hypothetical protein